jgi:hypothetical protein
MDEPQLKPCWVPPWFKLKVIRLVEGKALRMIVVYTFSFESKARKTLAAKTPQNPKKFQVSLSAP